MLTWAVPAWSGTAQASFAVQIQLDNSSYCVSQVISGPGNAVVSVVCNSNQFVSINEQPGTSFYSNPSGVYYFPFLTDDPQKRNLMNSDGVAWRNGYGTSTSMRIFFTDELQELREMLVTF